MSGDLPARQRPPVDPLAPAFLARRLLNDWARVEFAVDALDIRRRVLELRLKRIGANHSDEFEHELKKLIGTEIKEGELTFRFTEQVHQFLNAMAEDAAILERNGDGEDR